MSGNAARLVYVAVAVSLVVAVSLTVAVAVSLTVAVAVMVLIVVLVLPSLTIGLSLAAAGQVLRVVHVECCPCASLCGGGDDDKAGVLQMPQVLRMRTLLTLHWLLMCVCWCMTLHDPVAWLLAAAAMPASSWLHVATRSSHVAALICGL
jgi:hypothetical protein